MSKKETNDNRILRETWLRALKTPRGLEIDCGSKSAKQHLRLRLYKVAAECRRNPTADPELFEAVRQLSIVKDDEREGVLLMTSTASSGLLGRLAEQIGYSPEEEDRREVEASQAKFLEKMQKAAEDQATGVGKRVTPYYTRGE